METLHSSPDTLEDIIAQEPKLKHAYEVASVAHNGVKRLDGSDYITHPYGVAKIMCNDWGITNPEILSACLLHDVPEDTLITLEYIGQEFGEKVKFLVDGVTKLGSPKETTRKVLDKTLLDPIVGVIKLADDIHNLPTLDLMPLKNRLAKAKRILDVHAPLAESLGMWIVKTQLENMAFAHVDPVNHARFSKQFNEDPRVHDPFRSYMISRLESIMGSAGIPGYVTVRENSLVRLKDKKEPFLNINDVGSYTMVAIGAEPMVGNNCYLLLRLLRQEFKDQEDQSRFDDFYESPRFNKYSAIQITNDTPLGAVEVRITSEEKEDYNNWGVVSLLRKGEKSLKEYALKLVLTPTGQAKFLPPQATGLDLAYLINKKSAAQATSIIIDKNECPISTVIPNSSDVKIIYGSGRIAPNKEDVALSLPSTKKIAEKQFLEQKKHEEEIRGKEKVTKELARRGLLELTDLLRFQEYEERLANFLNYSGSKRSVQLLYRLVETGAISARDLTEQLDAWKITKEDLGLTSIVVEGIDGPNLLGMISGEIGKKFGGNIRWQEGGSKDGVKFKIRFVIENLDPKKEEKLKVFLGRVDRIKKITVV